MPYLLISAFINFDHYLQELHDAVVESVFSDSLAIDQIISNFGNVSPLITQISGRYLESCLVC